MVERFSAACKSTLILAFLGVISARVCKSEEFAKFLHLWLQLGPVLVLLLDSPLNLGLFRKNGELERLFVLLCGEFPLALVILGQFVPQPITLQLQGGPLYLGLDQFLLHLLLLGADLPQLLDKQEVLLCRRERASGT